MGNSASIMITRQEPCADCCATIAIWPLATPSPKQPHDLWSSTSDFTSERIASIEPAGVAEVFDLQIAETENFIANGLVSHNTRWHEDDLAGRLLNEAQQGGDQWEVIELPALNADGDALWPEKYDRARLEQIRATIGSRNWSALYQQRPTLEEGAMFKRQWFTGTADEPHIVDETPWNLRWVRYWDLAASTKTSADYTASASVAIDGDGVLWIRDLIRGRWEWPDAKRIMRENMLGEVRNTSHVVEEALHGIAALQELRRDPALHGIPLYGYRVDRDKVQRAMAWASRAEAGKVRLVRGEWVNAFLDEVCSFPLATHDDQVDAVSGAVATYATAQGRQSTIQRAVYRPASYVGARHG